MSMRVSKSVSTVNAISNATRVSQVRPTSEVAPADEFASALGFQAPIEDAEGSSDAGAEHQGQDGAETALEAKANAAPLPMKRSGAQGASADAPSIESIAATVHIA